ncbi:hypothetical protein VNI00_004392 [Paramarasmius palmivorus]|uniref:BZIP domain-containing protein n=1 Tax=Paramarasmius palmivorus TaxID=297713 RepID=A0AAW0DQA2_9AGAR
MPRGRKKDNTLPPNRSRDTQRAYRARKAAQLEALQHKLNELEAENERLRLALKKESVDEVPCDAKEKPVDSSVFKEDPPSEETRPEDDLITQQSSLPSVPLCVTTLSALTSDTVTESAGSPAKELSQPSEPVFDDRTEEIIVERPPKGADDSLPRSPERPPFSIPSPSHESVYEYPGVGDQQFFLETVDTGKGARPRGDNQHVTTQSTDPSVVTTRGTVHFRASTSPLFFDLPDSIDTFSSPVN